MVQMVGVIILALGLPPVFHSIDAGHTIDNSVTVAGYVVMRLSMIFLWLRAAAGSASTPGLPDLRGYHQRCAARLDHAAARAHHRRGVLRVGPGSDSDRTGRSGYCRARQERHTVARPTHCRAIRAADHHHPRRDGDRDRRLAGRSGPVSGLEPGCRAGRGDGTGLTFGLWWMYFTVPAGAVLQVHR